LVAGESQSRRWTRAIVRSRSTASSSAAGAEAGSAAARRFWSESSEDTNCMLLATWCCNSANMARCRSTKPSALARAPRKRSGVRTMAWIRQRSSPTRKA
jgi:hypothetical protein